MKRSPHLPTNSELMNCISKAKTDGYIYDFKIDEAGLFLKENAEFYFPDQIKINDSLYFNRHDHPSENVILYLVETTDGYKGMLINGYDQYADRTMASLIKQVEDVSKKFKPTQE